jgi:hypothetical protein
VAFSETIEAQLTAICLRAPSIAHQTEAGRILATDKVAELSTSRTPMLDSNETWRILEAASLAPQPLAPGPCVAIVSGFGGAGSMLWCRPRFGGVDGAPFVPPTHPKLRPNGEVELTAEEVWQSRVQALPMNATAVIAAATGTFDLAGTAADLIAFRHMNPAADPGAWAALWTDLFGEEP